MNKSNRHFFLILLSSLILLASLFGCNEESSTPTTPVRKFEKPYLISKRLKYSADTAEQYFYEGDKLVKAIKDLDTFYFEYGSNGFINSSKKLNNANIVNSNYIYNQSNTLVRVDATITSIVSGNIVQSVTEYIFKPSIDTVLFYNDLNKDTTIAIYKYSVDKQNLESEEFINRYNYDITKIKYPEFYKSINPDFYIKRYTNETQFNKNLPSKVEVTYKNGSMYNKSFSIPILENGLVLDDGTYIYEYSK